MIDPYIPDRGADGYRAVRYELDLQYAIASNRLSGVARVSIVPERDLAAFDLDLAGLRVSKVVVDRRPARWRHRGAKLRVTPAAPLPAAAEVVVEVAYAGNPRPAPSPWGPIGWEELTDGALVASQPSGACTWFPCNDHAAQKASYRVTITADSTHRVVASGRLVHQRAHGSTTAWTYEQPEPTSPYLVAVHVGRYDELELGGDRAPVPVSIVATPEHRAGALRAMARVPDMLAVFVDRFGPYPFESGYRVVVCPEPLEMPVEAQASAAFGTNHLDAASERLVAHELAHQWFGNSVTAGAWRDVWLHEGFACYGEWLWSEASGGASADECARAHHARLAELPQDLVLADPGPASMFDDRVYKRGALTLHAVRVALGDDAFFALLRRWTAEHRHGVVATRDFTAMVTAAGGPSLSPWLDVAELPPLS